MTLNASGPISLGGSTTGESINLELGQSATASISLGSFNTRGLAGVPSGAIALPTNFWGKTGYPAVSDFISRVYSAGQWSGPVMQNALTDSSGNIYTYGTENNTGIMWVAKFNASGTIQWQKKYTLSSGATINTSGSACIDSSNNLYFIATDYTTYKNGYLVKINSSGAQLFCRPVTVPAAWNFYDATSVRLDSAGNPIALFRIQNTSTYESPGLVVKFNTSGDINWQKYFVGSPAGNFVGGNYLYIDSSDNIYVNGTAYYSFQNYTVTVKINSSGTFQWSYAFWVANPSAAYTTLGPAVNSSNIYAVQGVYDGSSLYKMMVGTIALASGAFTPLAQYSELFGYQVTLTSDTSNNLYLLAARQGAAKYTLMKFNTSGVLQYQTDISRAYEGGSYYYPAFSNVKVNGTSVVLVGTGGTYSPGTNGALMLQIPADNSLSGSTLTYATGASTTLSAGTFPSIALFGYSQSNWAYASLAIGPLSVYPNLTMTITDTTWSVQRTLQP